MHGAYARSKNHSSAKIAYLYITRSLLCRFLDLRLFELLYIFLHFRANRNIFRTLLGRFSYPRLNPSYLLLRSRELVTLDMLERRGTLQI